MRPFLLVPGRIVPLMFGLPGAVAVTVLMAASFAGLWFILPLWYRRNGG